MLGWRLAGLVALAVAAYLDQRFELQPLLTLLTCICCFAAILVYAFRRRAE